MCYAICTSHLQLQLVIMLHVLLKCNYIILWTLTRYSDYIWKFNMFFHYHWFQSRLNHTLIKIYALSQQVLHSRVYEVPAFFILVCVHSDVVFNPDCNLWMFYLPLTKIMISSNVKNIVTSYDMFWYFERIGNKTNIYSLVYSFSLFVILPFQTSLFNFINAIQIFKI